MAKKVDTRMVGSLIDTTNEALSFMVFAKSVSYNFQVISCLEDNCSSSSSRGLDEEREHNIPYYTSDMSSSTINSI